MERNYKILPEDLICKGFQYHEGLNTDSKAFDTLECSNGLHFSNAEHILEFCGYGTMIADVEIPEGEMICHFDNKSKAHSIILKNIHPLWTVETFQELLHQDVDLHADDDYALQSAAGNGHLDVMKFLIEHGADIHADNDYALQWAAEKGHLEIVQFLIEHGANVRADSDCALQSAAENGHLDVVKCLVEHGANIHACNDYALEYATSSVKEYLSML